MKINYKELINPLILLPIIILIVYISGIEKFITYSFIFFFFISLTNNSILVLKKIIKKQHYLFVYSELFFSLFFLIPLFLILQIKNPILTSFFIISIADFSIQAFYNVTPREEGKEIVKLWKDKLIRSERRWFHPISMQKYVFKDFIIEIIEPSKLNPTKCYIGHDIFLGLKISKDIIQHQYGNKESIAFQILLDKKKLNKFSDYIHNENNVKEHFKAKLAKDSKVLRTLKKINKKLSSEIITAFMWKEKLRIVFKKEFVLNNSKKVYSFLKTLYNY